MYDPQKVNVKDLTASELVQLLQAMCDKLGYTIYRGQDRYDEYVIEVKSPDNRDF